MFIARLLSAFLVLWLAAAAALAQTTVTLQQGLNGYQRTTDATIVCCNNDLNIGSSPSMEIRNEGSDSGLIRFDIFQSEGGPVPDNATITSATLSLYKYDGPGGVFKASRLLKEWKEFEASWLKAKQGLNWQNQGAQAAGSDYAAADGQGSIEPASGCTTAPFPAACWLHIDVTRGVKDFASGAAQNYGWKIAEVSSDLPGNHKNFNTKDNNNASFAATRPKLTITYDAPPPPNGTTTTLQQSASYQGTSDATLVCCSELNTGSSPSMEIRAAGDSGVIRFAIFAAENGPVPNGATIQSARLFLYQYAGVGGTFRASRLLKNWNEGEVSWFNATTNPAASWTNPGAQGADNDYLAADTAQGSIVNPTGCTTAPFTCWLEIDVTGSVQDFASGASPNFGWKIAEVNSSTPGSHKNFNTSNNTNGTFATTLPKLVIVHSGGGGGTPTAPTAQLTASPPSGAAPLAVEFNASATATGGSAITNLRLQFGDGGEVNWTDKNVRQSHTYGAGGPYTATLTATNAVGTSTPKTVTITVGGTSGNLPTPHLSANPTGGLAPLAVTFNASQTLDGGSPITSLRLQFGHNNQEITWSDKNVSQSYTYPVGTYTATLTATNASGTSSGATQQINVTDGTIPPSLPAQGRAVTTFHSIGLYWEPAGNDVPLSGKGVPVRYRKAGDGFWRRGYDMAYDTRAFTVDGAALEKARGSVVHVDAGTAYVVQFGKYDSTGNIAWVKETTASTWSEQFPEGTIDHLPATISNGTSNVPALHVTSGGSPGAYRVLNGAQNGTRITANTLQANDSAFGIRISASYVIIRNVTVVGGTDGIRIDDGVHDVVIESSDISGYGRPDGRTNPDFGYVIGHNEDAAIRTDPSEQPEERHRGIRRIVIQRNKIHDPAYGANIPGRDGPKHIDMLNTGGNHVIRYNEFYATNGDLAHYVQDAISGGHNDTLSGAPGQDSDIYMNRIEHCIDDGIEAEGGGQNVRVWKNYTDLCAVGIATTGVGIGPTYVWRNVHNRSRLHYARAWDADDRLPAFKSGSFGAASNGWRYLFHNSVMQLFDASLGNRGLGHGGGPNGGGPSQLVTNTVSRNNIYHHWRSDSSPFWDIGQTGNDFDYDLAISYALAPAGSYPHQRLGTPTFKAAHGPGAFAAGRYQLAPNTAGYDEGEPLFNFNSDVGSPHQYQGVAPDIGAHEDGSADMVFGVGASGS